MVDVHVVLADQIVGPPAPAPTSPEGDWTLTGDGFLTPCHDIVMTASPYLASSEFLVPHHATAETSSCDVRRPR